MVELKPCPFCGRKPRKYQHILFHRFDGYIYRSKRYWIVECGNPACPVIVRTYGKAKTEDEAIALWNRRMGENE